MLVFLFYSVSNNPYLYQTKKKITNFIASPSDFISLTVEPLQLFICFPLISSIWFGLCHRCCCCRSVFFLHFHVFGTFFCSLVECWHGPERTKNHAESNKKRKIYIIIIFYDARLLAVCFLFVVCWFSQCDLRNSLY